MTPITGTSFGDWQRRATCVGHDDHWQEGAGLGTAAVAADSEEEDDDADRRIETAPESESREAKDNSDTLPA
jgi:hypothetical protein